MFTVNGKPARPGDLAKTLNDAAVASISAQLRERLESIRLPATGEFPTVVIEGDSITDLSIRVEGSAELLELVKERLSPEEQAGFAFKATSATSVPRAFLSYGSEDRVLAEAIARELTQAGIETWWDRWEMSAGDSLRQKIDDGLSNCTHFIVLLTPASRVKPWVNQEMDAGLVRRLQAQCTFIPLRHNLDPSHLPPLLSGMLSPEVDAGASNLAQLIQDILGVTKKPPLGTLPAITRIPSTEYSPAACAVAEVFVRHAEHGLTGEVQFSLEDLSTRTGLSHDDTGDALHELRSFFIEASRTYLARASLYAVFDRYFKDFIPADDALKLAADLTNEAGFPTAPKEIAERYGWPPRRLNSAITFLREREIIRGLDALSTKPFVVFALNRTDATRRFVKSRS